MAKDRLRSASLQKARFFLDRLKEAEQADPFDEQAAGAYLEAAILFGKATQYAIESKVKLKATRLWNDPLCRFVADLRDVIVHEDGSAEVEAKTSVTVSVSATAVGVSSAFLTATITRANPTPWQRVQMRRQAQADKKSQAYSRKREEKRLRRLRARLREEARERARQLPPDEHKTKIHFVNTSAYSKHADPRAEALPATDVVGHWLDLLEDSLDTIPSSRS